MSLTVDDAERRGRRSRSLSRNRAGDVDADLANLVLRDRPFIRDASPFEDPPIINDDIPVRWADPPRALPADAYEYEKRPASAYQIASSSAAAAHHKRTGSLRDTASWNKSSSPRASSAAFQAYYPAGAVSQYLVVDEDRKRERVPRDNNDDDHLAYGKLPGPERNAATFNNHNPTYADSPPEREPMGVKYGHVPRDPSPGIGILRNRHHQQRSSWYGPDPSASSPSVLTVEPPSSSSLSSPLGPPRRERSRPRSGTSPVPPTAAGRLSTAAAAFSSSAYAAAPPSPLLESYHGTYQQASPLPSPLLGASQPPENLLAPPLLSSAPYDDDDDDDDERGGPPGRRRRARFHDAEDIATRLANALKGSGMPDVEPLIEILPGLTHDQVMELRDQYKAIVKTGPDRKGVNVAKHIRARLKDDDASLMKACYATALGRWESEAYWANFWYQGDKTRRELLIEALMGRPNDEIRLIKDSFCDKKYDNSLVKCMRTELKEDKFKKAVLVVLDERRMPDFDRHARRIPVDMELVDRDVDDLRRAFSADKGGETLMISVVVTRSDSHLRHVLKEYERLYKSNFARDCLKKSSNLVGELMAHILNGVINKPVRDALLLHHALTASRKDPLRRELLISRLVRCHWDREHFARVRAEFAHRYHVSLQQAVAEAVKGDTGEFLAELCISRMPDDVRRISVMGRSE